MWSCNATEHCQVHQLNAGFLDSEPTDLVSVNGRLYFAATEPTAGKELYSCTADRVCSRVSDINSGSASASPRGMTAFNGEVWFKATDGSNPGLWKCTGADVCTEVDNTFTPFVSVKQSLTNDVPHFFVVRDRLFMVGTAAATGQELHSCTAAGACSVAVDIRSGTQDSDPSFLTVYNDKLWFNADDGSGEALWSCDGAASCSKHPGPVSDPEHLAVFDGRLYL